VSHCRWTTLGKRPEIPYDIDRTLNVEESVRKNRVRGGILLGSNIGVRSPGIRWNSATTGGAGGFWVCEPKKPFYAGLTKSLNLKKERLKSPVREKGGGPKIVTNGSAGLGRYSGPPGQQTSKGRAMLKASGEEPSGKPSKRRRKKSTIARAIQKGYSHMGGSVLGQRLERATFTLQREKKKKKKTKGGSAKNPLPGPTTKTDEEEICFGARLGDPLLGDGTGGKRVNRSKRKVLRKNCC